MWVAGATADVRAELGAAPVRKTRTVPSVAKDTIRRRAGTAEGSATRSRDNMGSGLSIRMNPPGLSLSIQPPRLGRVARLSRGVNRRGSLILYRLAGERLEQLD